MPFSFCSGFIPHLLVIFTTELTECTEEVIKDKEQLLDFEISVIKAFYLGVARCASVFSVVQKIKTLFTTEVTECTEVVIKDKS